MKPHDLVVIGEQRCERRCEFGLSERLGQPGKVKHVVGRTRIARNEEDTDVGMARAYPSMPGIM